MNRLHVLAAAWVFAIAVNALAGYRSQTVGDAYDEIMTTRAFYSMAYSLENGSVYAKRAIVQAGTEICLYLDGRPHNVVDLDLYSMASVRRNGFECGETVLGLRLATDDDVLPQWYRDTVIFDMSMYQYSAASMETTVGAQTISYNLGFGGAVRFDLTASTGMLGDIPIAEINGDIRMWAGFQRVAWIDSGELAVEVLYDGFYQTVGDLELDMKASSKAHIGSWTKLTLKKKRQYLALVGTDMDGAKHTTVVTDRMIPAVDTYLYDARVKPRVAPSRHLLVR
jgi:hypothetical protein